MSALSKIQEIKNIKTDIKQVLIDKGADMTNVPFAEYADKIDEISDVKLTGNATTDDVLSGKTFYNTNVDEIQTGTLALSGDATTGDVLSGKTFYNTDANEIQTGTLALNGNATTGDVLSGKTFYNTDANEIQTGTLALNGNATTSDVLSGKTFYNTDAKTKVSGTLALSGDATANDVLSGKTFYNTDAKTKVSGTLALSGNATASNVLSGYTFYNTDAKTKVSGTLALSGDAVASNVLSGKTFYNTDAKTKVTGTMTNRGAVTKTFTPSKSTQTYTIPAGYHNGSGKVTCNAMSGYQVGFAMVHRHYNSHNKYPLDLGSVKSITKIYVMGGGNNTYKTEYSTDNANWTSLGSFDGATDAMVTVTYGAISARYVRVTATQTGKLNCTAVAAVYY